MATGRFVWFEYQAPTAEHAVLRAFYEGVMSWGRAAQGAWTTAAAHQPVASIIDGVPPRWVGYVQVPSVDEALDHATRLGAEVLEPATATATATGGSAESRRYAELRDPFGAVFGVVQPSPDGEPGDGLGALDWAETHSTDAHAAARFYSELFGWVATGETPTGSPTAVYLMLGTEPGKPRFGISNMAGEMKQPPHWAFYANVPDIAAALATTKQLGGRPLFGPMPSPDGHQIAAGFDPQGVMFGLVQRRA